VCSCKNVSQQPLRAFLAGRLLFTPMAPNLPDREEDPAGPAGVGSGPGSGNRFGPARTRRNGTATGGQSWLVPGSRLIDRPATRPCLGALFGSLDGPAVRRGRCRLVVGHTHARSYAVGSPDRPKLTAPTPTLHCTLLACFRQRHRRRRGPSPPPLPASRSLPGRPWAVGGELPSTCLQRRARDEGRGRAAAADREGRRWPRAAGRRPRA